MCSQPEWTPPSEISPIACSLPRRELLAAVHAYLDDFGHEEADVLRRVKELHAKLEAA